MLHKCNAPLLVFLVQALGLFQFFIDQNLPVLIANNEDLRPRRDLAAILTYFIQLVIDCRLDNPLMLIGHVGDILQIEVRQEMIGNRVTDNCTVGFLIVNQQPQRQQRDDLFVNGAQGAQFAIGGGRDGGTGLTAAAVVMAKRRKTEQR